MNKNQNNSRNQSLDSIDRAFSEFAGALHIDTTDLGPTEIRQEIFTYLNDKEYSPWLLLIDNVEDISVVKNKFSQEFFSEDVFAGGKIVVTTRVALGWEGLMMKLSGMTEKEAVNLLYGYDQDDSSFSEELLEVFF